LRASVRLALGARRDTCIDCAKCAKACPALLPVDKLITVRSPECTACLECVTVCPEQGALWLSAGGRRPMPAWVLAAAMAVIFLGIVGYARWTGRWATDIPSQVYDNLIPRAGEFSHRSPFLRTFSLLGASNPVEC